MHKKTNFPLCCHTRALERWKGRKLNGLDFSPEASERPETMEAANVVHLEALILPCHFCLEL